MHHEAGLAQMVQWWAKSGRRIKVLFPAQAKYFPYLQRARTGNGAHSASCSLGPGDSSWG